LLKQGLNAPMPVEEQCIAIYAGTKGWLDTIPVEDVRRFESELLTNFRAQHSDLLYAIRETGALPEATALDAAMQSFVNGFAVTTK
jgi:F-type H+-transporting ATPase subunit alpha